MTRRQQDLLAFVRDFIAEHSVSPSYEEIGVALALKTKSGVSRLVHELVDRGLLVAEGGNTRLPRCLRVPSESSDYRRGYQDGFAAAQVAASVSEAA